MSKTVRTWEKLGARLALSGSLLLCTTRAHAQEQRDPAAAEELFRQGRAAAEQHDYANACAKFRESNRLDPAVGTLFNMADCEERLGHLATSWTLFQEVSQRLPSDDDRKGMAQKRARALESRVPMLTIHLRSGVGSALRVRRDDVELGGASLDTALPVDPGEHVVRVEAEGRVPSEFRVRLAASDHLELEVRPGASRSEGSEGSEGTSSKPQQAQHAAYALGVAGIAGLVTGAVAGILVLNRKNTVDKNCQDHVCNQAGLDAAHSGKTWGIVTSVGLATGALGLGTATYLLLSAPAVDDSRRSAAYLIGIRAKW